MIKPNDIIHKFELHLLFKIPVKTAPSTHKLRTQGFQLAMVSRIRQTEFSVSTQNQAPLLDKCFMTLQCAVNDANLGWEPLF